MGKNYKKVKPSDVVPHKQPIQRNNMFSQSPKWKFARADKEQWAIDQYFSTNHMGDFLKHLKDYESMRWYEIMQASGGKSHGTNSHFIEVEKLCREAQQRLRDMSIEEDSIFSLRLGNKPRLWGLIDHDGTFHVLWYDPEHEIYPVQPK